MNTIIRQQNIPASHTISSSTIHIPCHAHDLEDNHLLDPVNGTQNNGFQTLNIPMKSRQRKKVQWPQACTYNPMAPKISPIPCDHGMHNSITHEDGSATCSNNVHVSVRMIHPCFLNKNHLWHPAHIPFIRFLHSNKRILIRECQSIL